MSQIEEDRRNCVRDWVGELKCRLNMEMLDYGEEDDEDRP